MNLLNRRVGLEAEELPQALERNVRALDVRTVRSGVDAGLDVSAHGRGERRELAVWWGRRRVWRVLGGGARKHVPTLLHHVILLGGGGGGGGAGRAGWGLGGCFQSGARKRVCFFQKKSLASEMGCPLDGAVRLDSQKTRHAELCQKRALGRSCALSSADLCRSVAFDVCTHTPCVAQPFGSGGPCGRSRGRSRL